MIAYSRDYPNIREVKHDVYGRRQTAKTTSDFLLFCCNSSINHTKIEVSLAIHSKYKYFDSTVQRAENRRQKFHFCRLPFVVNVMLNLSIVDDIYVICQHKILLSLKTALSTFSCSLSSFCFEDLLTSLEVKFLTCSTLDFPKSRYLMIYRWHQVPSEI